MELKDIEIELILVEARSLTGEIHDTRNDRWLPGTTKIGRGFELCCSGCC